MFKKAFETIRDLNYVKVTKENWSKIENLFAEKEKKIQDLGIVNKEQAAKILEQEAELDILRKYQKNDDLIFFHEEQSKKDKIKYQKIQEEIDELAAAIQKADSKVKSALSLESAYLQRIIRAEAKARVYGKCPSYETKGDSLISFYA